MSDVSRWLNWNETQTFERKSCYDKGTVPPIRLEARRVADFIAETLSAMANADGGVLLVEQENLRVNGADSGGTITGVDYSAGSLELLRSAPSRLIVPPLDSAVVETHLVEGKTLLLFQIASSPIAHHLTDGRCLLRIDTKNAPYDCGIVAQLKQNQSPFERRPVPEASLTDLDPEALDWFAVRTGWKGDYASLLDEYHLRRDGVLNRAAILLFAKRPGSWLDHVEVTLVRYFGTKRGVGENYRATPPQRIMRPLVRLIEETYKAVAAHIEVRVELRDLFFENRADYPEFAWQEAIVNAVAHRDYAITGAGIEVWLFDDHIDIRSPGRLPAPITVDALQRAVQHELPPLHQSRNPLIARALTDCGYMREQGEGFPRMFQAMEEADLAPPELLQYEYLFLVTLRKTPLYDAETRRWLRQFEASALSREQRKLLAFAHSRGMQFTNRDTQKQLRLDLYSASNLIKSLIRKGIVRLTEKGGRTYEVITPQTPEDIPEALLTLLPAFQEKNYLGSKDIMALLGLSYTQVNRRIRKLVDAEWLTPSQARGRFATYYLTNKSKAILSNS